MYRSTPLDKVFITQCLTFYMFELLYLDIHDEFVMKRIRFCIDLLRLIKASSHIILALTGEIPTMTLALYYTSLNSNLTPTMQKVSPLVKP